MQDTKSDVFQQFGLLASSGTILDARAPVIDPDMPTLDERACEACFVESIRNLECAPPAALVRGRDGRLRSCFGIHRLVPNVRRLCEADPIQGLAAELLSEPVEIYQSHLNIKWPRSVHGHYSFHRDALYFQHRDGVTDASRVVGVAVALGAVGPLMGPLVTLLGTHHSYPAATTAGFAVSSTHQLRHDTESDPGVVEAAGLVSRGDHVFTAERAGQVAVFDPRCVHASADNLSSRVRPLLLIFFAPRRVFPNRLTADNPYLHEVI